MNTVNGISLTSQDFKTKQHENNELTFKTLQKQEATLEQISAVFQQMMLQSSRNSEPKVLGQVYEAQHSIVTISESSQTSYYHNTQSTVSVAPTETVILEDPGFLPADDVSGVHTACGPEPSATWCNCSCHTRQYLCFPGFFEHITGRVSIQHVGLPYLTGPCNQRSCRKRSRAAAHFTYYFPPWLLWRMISVTIAMTDFQRCEIVLRAPRVVPDTADLFRLASNGDKNGIVTLFDEGKASPYDIDSTNGVNALTYTIIHGHVEVWRLLLKAGADPYQESKARQSSIDIAWGRILAQSLSSEVTAALRNDFDATEYLEIRQFPILHQIVLGFTKTDLRTQLELDTSTINSTDWQGRTALSWAAARGDRESVDALLEYGADPNICASNGSSPLHFAARATSPDCLKPLLQYGAHVNHRNKWLTSALRYATTDRDDIRYIIPLLDKGADINICHMDGRTALMCAVDMNRPNIAGCLLKRGATLGEVDSWGYRPITTAITNNFHEVLRVLFKHGAGISTQNHGQAILDNLGAYADLETMQILLVAPNSAFEKVSEKLALETLEQREDMTPEMKADFRILINRLAKQWGSECSNANDIIVREGVWQDEEVEEFEDALEFQEC